MAGWILIACLKQLFTEFDLIAPARDHASDGAVGDTAHQHEVSDHNPDETGSVPIHDADHINEVHAIDVDVDLREPGLTMEMVVQFLLDRCRSGKESRLRYIIYNRRIWEADNGWRERPYTGASPHIEHAHFSASYDTGKEASTASWHLEDIPVALTAADKTWITSTIRAEVAAVAGQVWSYQLEMPESTTTPKEKKSAGAIQRYGNVVALSTRKDVIDALAPAIAELKAAIDPQQPAQ